MSHFDDRLKKMEFEISDLKFKYLHNISENDIMNGRTIALK